MAEAFKIEEDDEPEFHHGNLDNNMQRTLAASELLVMATTHGDTDFLRKSSVVATYLPKNSES